jgi:hypothetical protein
MRFLPGDRVLVRVHTKLDKDQITKITKTIKRWAGPDAEVLVIDSRTMDIEVEHSSLVLRGKA